MLSPSSLPSSAQSTDEALSLLFRPDFQFMPDHVAIDGAMIAYSIHANPDSFFPLWREMKETIAQLGGPDEAFRLFQHSPLANITLPSHQALQKRNGHDRAHYMSFDVEDLGALRQLVSARVGNFTMPPAHATRGVANLRANFVKATQSILAMVDYTGETRE